MYIYLQYNVSSSLALEPSALLVCVILMHKLIRELFIVDEVYFESVSYNYIYIKNTSGSVILFS